jgi:hypothetical protein
LHALNSKTVSLYINLVVEQSEADTVKADSKSSKERKKKQEAERNQKQYQLVQRQLLPYNLKMTVANVVVVLVAYQVLNAWSVQFWQFII